MQELNGENETEMTISKAILGMMILMIVYICVFWLYAGDYIQYYNNKHDYMTCQTQIKRIAPKSTGSAYYDYEWNGQKCEGIDSAGVTDYEGKQIDIAIHKITGESFRTELVFDVLFVAVVFGTIITVPCFFAAICTLGCKIREYLVR